MGGRATYKTLSPKRAHFQIGVEWWSHLRKVHRRRRISHTYPMLLWGCSSCEISSPGPVFHGTKWLLWRPHTRSPTLHSRCGINKGLIKRGSTIDHWKSRCKGRIFWPTPHINIRTFTLYCDTTDRGPWFNHPVSGCNPSFYPCLVKFCESRSVYIIETFTVCKVTWSNIPPSSHSLLFEVPLIKKKSTNIKYFLLKWIKCLRVLCNELKAQNVGYSIWPITRNVMSASY
jgi:hypothetical protein